MKRILSILLALTMLLYGEFQQALFVDPYFSSTVSNTLKYSDHVTERRTNLADGQADFRFHLAVNGDVVQLNVGLTSRQAYPRYRKDKQVV